MARNRVTDMAPPRLLRSDIIELSDDPLIGLLTMDTDDGTFELAINLVVAAQLLASLEAFLSPQDPQ